MKGNRAHVGKSRTALERLDEQLANFHGADEDARINEIRRMVFGVLPEDKFAETAQSGADQDGNIA